MPLTIRNREITTPVYDILVQLRDELNDGRFRTLDVKDGNIQTQCPIHKLGKESKPSCSIHTNINDGTETGWVHCFTCGYNVPLYKMIADCFGKPSEYGKEWLLDRFGYTLVEQAFVLPEISLTKVKPQYLDESILEPFKKHTNYWAVRHISDEVAEHFGMGYDSVNDMVVFPVRDEFGRLVMLTKRSTHTKFFHIDENKEKPVFLLYDLIHNHQDTAYVAESQINALTLRTWGYNGVALIGTGSSNQYKILKRSGIRHFILCLDGDEAGDKGVRRFVDAMPDDVFISQVIIPRGKDVNDLTKEEFEHLEIKSLK